MSRYAIVPIALYIACAVSACGPVRRVAMDRDKADLRQACDLRGAPGVAPLVGKIPMSPAEIDSLPLQMLTLESYATDDEKTAIEAYANAWEAHCKPKQDMFLQNYLSGYPEVRPIVDAARAAQKAILADLYLGRQTFAQANRQRQTIVVGMNDALAKVDAAYRAREQAQAAAFAQAYIASIPRPTTTTCFGGPGFATCNTR